MTAKNRHKSSSGEKSAASSQEDAKKSPKISSSSGSSSNGVSGPAPQGPPRSGSCLALVASTVFYIALIGAVGFAAFHLQQVVEEMRTTSAGQEESARLSAELASKMDSVVQQVESLASVVDGLESSLKITRVELEGSISRMKRGEVETRRVEEALQRLQNDLLRDLSEGISEVKQARERDFSSLEKTVEERLAEASQSIRASVTEFTEAQGETQSQLADLKARLGDMEDPALIKQELTAIVDVVAEIKTAKEASDASADSLREQIGAVRAELQTRNQEVASLSQEVQTVRSVVQETVGSLRQSLSEAEASVQGLRDRSDTLESSVEQAVEAARNVERNANEAAAQVRKQSDDLEVRVKASEENGDSLSASVSDISSRVEGEMEALKSSLAGLQGFDQQVRDLEKRLSTLEGSSSGSVKPEQLQSLKSMVDGLEKKAAKLEGHDQAIAALQKALQQTTRTLADISKAKAKK
ncbi:cytoskeleton-associated protein 4 [Acanthopagrus latus]|uniref:cytoskeleton-associated protein 4 n=1 Tax=Acanthopagrus latus TaxID=8177 RepID=UPI00187D0C69|nr:cytoskeleton-associated protein 4 [Acanthopagrus latus]